MTQHFDAEHSTPAGDVVAATTQLHSAFYRFVVIDDVDQMVAHLRDLTTSLMGSILVAHEGINGVVAGPAAALSIIPSLGLRIRSAITGTGLAQPNTGKWNSASSPGTTMVPIRST